MSVLISLLLLANTVLNISYILKEGVVAYVCTDKDLSPRVLSMNPTPPSRCVAGGKPLPTRRFPPEAEAEAPQLRRGTRSPEVLLTGDVVTVLFILVTSSPAAIYRPAVAMFV